MKEKEETRKIYDITTVSSFDPELTGIEAQDLSKLTINKVAIPEAFVVTTENFDEFIQENQLVDFIIDILARVEDKNTEIERYSKNIQKRIVEGKLGKNLTQEIAAFYKKFSGLAKTPVAVFPSSISRTLSESMNYKGEDHELVFGLEDLYLAIKKMWSELFSAEAMIYRERIKYEGPITLAVVVMKQPVAEVSVIAECMNPLSESRRVEIEAILGNIDPLLQAEIVGDRYILNLETFELLEKSITEQKWMQVFRFEKGKFRKQKFDISEIWKSRQKLSDNQINKIGHICEELINQYKHHFSAYFAVEMGKIVLLSVDHDKETLSPVKLKDTNGSSNFEILRQKLESEPEIELPSEVMKKSIPEYVAEVENLMTSTTDEVSKPEVQKQAEIESAEKIETGAGVYAMDFDQEKSILYKNNINGYVSLSGDDFVIKSGKRVEDLIDAKAQTIEQLVGYITQVTGAVKQTVFYNFVSDAYRQNTDALFGAARMIAGESLADIELEAIRIVRNKMGHKHLWVSVPFIRDESEFGEVKKMISLSKLRRSPTFKIYATIDNAISAMLVEDIIESGVDGFIFDLDELAKNTLGVYAPTKTPLSGLKRILEYSLVKVGKRRVKSIVKGEQIETDFHIKELLKLGATDFGVKMNDILSTKNILKESEKRRLSK